jgi:aldehyde dehydrogenase (NAD+)
VAADPHFASLTLSGEIDRIVEAQREHRRRVSPPLVEERIARIRRMEQALLARRAEFHEALWDDYRKPAAEVDLSEIFPVVGEARHAARHLRQWARPRRVRTPMALAGSRSRLLYEPKGVVLIISPWNFPVNLTLGPLVSAIAAGNSVVIKPSEMTPHTAGLMKRVLADLFDETEVALVEGDATVAQALLRKRFDHIFFTGSPRVGRVVMKAAAEHLTSVTLELGGKSPVIVDKTANLDEAARKIAWGKYFNSGQICIAPDYLLVDETVSSAFAGKLVRAIEALGGEASRSALVNENHGDRLRQLLDDARARGARVITGGETAGASFAPTVIENVHPDSEVMREEIFGPLLPIVPYRTIEDALAVIADREKPLVLYVFSRSRQFVDRVLQRTSSGGAVVNDALLHFYQLNLPFGGVGESGMGKAHGFFGFEAFSNARGILDQPTRFSGIQFLYPPYTPFKQKLINLMLRYF